MQKYVLLPLRGLRSPDLADVRSENVLFNRALAARMLPAAMGHGAMAGLGGAAALPAPGAADTFRVIHTLSDDGPKLVEATPEAINALHAEHADVRAVPVVTYQVATRPQERAQLKVHTAGFGPIVFLAVKVVHAATGRPVAGAMVVAFTDHARRQGDQALSNAQGVAKLRLGGRAVAVELLVVYPPHSHWGLMKRSVTLVDASTTIQLRPIDLSHPDFIGELYGAPDLSVGRGVTVGVIDTGVDGEHPDLEIAGGAVFVTGEGDAGGWGPATTDGDHGTHVAGIIASRGQRPSGKAGIAPGVALHAYRVFPNAGGGAENYDIVRAIERGVSDGCDLLNLSFGSRVADEAVKEVIAEAFEAGTVCIVAAGNDGRASVSYPGVWDEALAISATGKSGTFPPDSTEVLDLAPPQAGSNKDLFVAAFSNVGPEIDLTGPGVGIVSTLPAGRYGVMSGTSMACPAVTGAAAARLGQAQQRHILDMPRDRRRALAISALVRKAARRWGFPSDLEGAGHIP